MLKNDELVNIVTKEEKSSYSFDEINKRIQEIDQLIEFAVSEKEKFEDKAASLFDSMNEVVSKYLKSCITEVFSVGEDGYVMNINLVEHMNVLDAKGRIIPAYSYLEKKEKLYHHDLYERDPETNMPKVVGKVKIELVDDSKYNAIDEKLFGDMWNEIKNLVI
jgi:hypothetical protein